MASLLSRRLTSHLLNQIPHKSLPLASLFHNNLTTLSHPHLSRPPLNTPSPSSKPPTILNNAHLRPQFLLHQNPTTPIPLLSRSFSSPSNPTNPNSNGSTGPELRHQEIVGPTVDRDLSALANETRQTLETLQESISKLSSGLAFLASVHLALGIWLVCGVSWFSYVVMVQALMAFAFPFSMAFLVRRTLKPIRFLRKMEELGRLQILTLALQVSKNLNLLFLRMRIVSFGCIVGISAGFLLTVGSPRASLSTV